MKETKPRPQYVISISQGGVKFGDVVIETFTDITPKTAHNFDSLVAAGFYNGLAFHRIVPGFMIQGGDPNSKNQGKETWGYGDPSQTRVPAEFNDVHHEPGILSMARSQDPNSATSQFFICVGDAGFLDHQYTAFGKVISGMDVVNKVAAVELTKQPRSSEDSSPVQKVEMTIHKK